VLLTLAGGPDDGTVAVGAKTSKSALKALLEPLDVAVVWVVLDVKGSFLLAAVTVLAPADGAGTEAAGANASKLASNVLTGLASFEPPD
jgi:hypothetical protein